ncbi:MAG TPA: hypothetical protein ENJ95_11620 [Bacteroidetes bacterium]|nr:hypothetical protein [Bacteroidota bacterium]
MKPEFIILCCALSFLLHGTVTCQNKIGMRMGITKSWRIITEAESDIYRSYRNEKETILTKPDFQINYYRKLNKNVSAAIGIGYSDIGYQIKRPLIDPCFSGVSCGYKIEIDRYRFIYLRVPVKLSASFFKRRILFEAGVSALFPTAKRHSWILRKKENKFIDQKIAKVTPLDINGGIQSSIDINIGYRFSPNKDIDIRLVVETSMLTDRYENRHIADNIYSIGMFAGQDKSTKERLVNMGLALEVLFDMN